MTRIPAFDLAGMFSGQQPNVSLSQANPTPVSPQLAEIRRIMAEAATGTLPREPAPQMQAGYSTFPAAGQYGQQASQLDQLLDTPQRPASMGQWNDTTGLAARMMGGPRAQGPVQEANPYLDMPTQDLMKHVQAERNRFADSAYSPMPTDELDAIGGARQAVRQYGLEGAISRGDIGGGASPTSAGEYERRQGENVRKGLVARMGIAENLQRRGLANTGDQAMAMASRELPEAGAMPGIGYNPTLPQGESAYSNDLIAAMGAGPAAMAAYQQGQAATRMAEIENSPEALEAKTRMAAAAGGSPELFNMLENPGVGIQSPDALINTQALTENAQGQIGPATRQVFKSIWESLPSAMTFNREANQRRFIEQAVASGFTPENAKIWVESVYPQWGAGASGFDVTSIPGGPGVGPGF
jgi:hypothetical protein